jgi:hypothetical protein
MDKDGKQPGIENQKLPSTKNATTKEYTQSGEDGAEIDKDGEQQLGTDSREHPTTNNARSEQLRTKRTHKKDDEQQTKAQKKSIGSCNKKCQQVLVYFFQI